MYFGEVPGQDTVLDLPRFDLPINPTRSSTICVPPLFSFQGAPGHSRRTTGDWRLGECLGVGARDAVSGTPRDESFPCLSTVPVAKGVPYLTGDGKPSPGWNHSSGTDTTASRLR